MSFDGENATSMTSKLWLVVRTETPPVDMEISKSLPAESNSIGVATRLVTNVN